MSFHAIIPAGGTGSRLWPLSRKAAPKFLADLTGVGRSLLQQTVDRLNGLGVDGADPRITIVTGAAHAQAVAEQVPQADILVEPSARGTMGAIGLAAAIIAQEDPDAIVGSFAADHLIADEEAFRAAVREAIGAAERGYVATIGITPEGPSTAYGYIETGEPLDLDASDEPCDAAKARPTSDGDGRASQPGRGQGPGSEAANGPRASEQARAVTAFVEKPDERTAREYLATGRYLWNAGMFVAKAAVLLDALEVFHPEIAEPLLSLAAAWHGDERSQAIARYWDPLPSAVIDTAVAEPLADAGGVAVVPVVMGWSDVGDYASLAGVIPETVRAAQVVPGASPQPVVEVDSPGALIYASGKPIAVVGVPGAVVVDMDDVLLVTTRDEAQKVKVVVEALGTAGLAELA